MVEFELVLPAYNEAPSLETVIRRTIEAAAQSQYSPDTFQLILVQNGSRDNSDSVLRHLKGGPMGSWFRVVTVPVNQGYGYGILSGLRETRAIWVGWSHADEQCDPRDVFKALTSLKKLTSHVLVKGTRSGRNWKDMLVSRVFEAFARIFLGLNINEINAQPKVFDAELLKHLTNPPFTFAFDLYVLYCAQKQGYRVQTIPVQFPPRVHGVSNWAANFLGRYRTILGMIYYMWRLSRLEGRL